MGDAMIRDYFRLDAPVFTVTRSAKQSIALLLDVSLYVLPACLAVYLRLVIFRALAVRHLTLKLQVPEHFKV